MHASKNSFLDHVKWFRNAISASGAEAIVSLESWNAFVRLGARQLPFFPQFQASIEGRLQYQPALTDDAIMFAGWLPYRLKRWEIAVDKLAFKRYAASAGLPTPAYWLTADALPKDVVVKSAKSSFGQQVLGPFRSCAEHALDIAQGEYYERFTEGQLLKIWFWDGIAVCAELDRMPRVWGDGVSSIRELITRRAAQHKQPAEAEKAAILARSQTLLRYYGRDLEQVLPKASGQVVEFRYGSTLLHATERKVLDLTGDAVPEWAAQLPEIGEKLYSAIPAQLRPGTLFTADAIVDRAGRIQLLEVNCNPTVHPLVYPAMARTMLDKTPVPDAALVH